MNGFQNFLTASALGAVVAASALAATTTVASADTVCNRYHECWTTHERYNDYPSSLSIQFHNDSWRRHHRHGYQWRADPQDDHGYYDHGKWDRFDQNGNDRQNQDREHH
jgi:hypothetical protein